MAYLRKQRRFVARICFLAMVISVLGFAVVAYAKEPVTIKYAAWWFTEAGRKEWLNAQLDKFEKENPDIRVERIAIASGDVHDRFMTEAAAGTGPDLLWFRDISMVPFAKFGFLEPLDRYINPKNYQLEEVNSTGIVNGKRYALNLMGFAYGHLIYNKKLLAEAGVKPPTTPEELLEAAQKLTKAPGQYGFGMPVDPGESEYFAQNIQKFASGFNATIAQNGKIAVNDPKFVQSMTWLKKIYDADVTPKGLGWRVQRRMFADDKIAMLCDGAYQFGVIDGFYPGHSKDFGAVRPPFPGNLSLFNQNFIGIAKSSKHKPEAVRLLKWWVRADNQLAFNTYGLHVGTVKTQFSTDFLNAHPYLSAYNDPKMKAVPTIVTGYEEQSEQIRRTLVDSIARSFFSDKPVKSSLDDAQKAIMGIVRK